MLILPSKIEGLPAVILEAMFVKTPVVAYNVGGISEVLQHKITGFLINDFDENNFVSSMSEIIECNIDNIKKTAHDLIIDNYLNSKIAIRFQNSYLKMITDSI
jgi:glycosyltransferase involved in cell wall biosynthesis